MTTKPAENKNGQRRIQMGCLSINGKTYPLYEGINTVGRNKDATIIIKDPSVSQQHALITIVNEKQHFVSDLRSFNGTIVESNKLNPLLLYEVSHDSVIHFANCDAVYKKMPGSSQSITDHSHNGGNMETTQNFNESFYTAQTQVFENDSTKATANSGPNKQGPALNYFEDDYNFADIPSPPAYQTSKENKNSSASATDQTISIHEMPTQIYCADVVSHVMIGEKEAEDSPDAGYEIITTKVDVHELPTQIICHEVAANDSVGEAQTEDLVQRPSIHDMPTQIIDKDSFSKEKCILVDKNNSNTRKDAVHNKPTQITNKNTELKDAHDNSLNDTLQHENKSNHPNTNRKSEAESSTDIIDETLLDDSGLDVTAESLQANNSGQGPMPPAVLEDNAILSLDSEPQSPLHVSQLHRRNLKPIAEDTEEDEITSSGSEIVKKLNKKHKALPESSPDDSNSEIIVKQKKKCRVIDSDNSGSETDIETDLDLQDTVKLQTSKLASESSTANTNDVSKTKSKLTNKKTEDKKASPRKNSSGSDTEIDEFEIEDQTSTTLQNKIKMRTTVITVGKAKSSGFEIKERNKPEVSSNKENAHSDISGSDTDVEDFVFELKNESTADKPAQNVNTSNELNETEIIPATQASEDDDDDFNFMPEGNSTLVTKGNTDQTTGHLFDVSQKLRELREASVVPQNCSEESIHLGLSEVIENNENAKNSDGQVSGNKNEDDDDKTPDISDIDESDDVCAKVKQMDTDKDSIIKKNDDIFDQPTQMITVNEKINEGNVQDVFSMETQNLTEDMVQKKKDDEIFVKPTTSKSLSSLKKQSGSQNISAKNSIDIEDDLFMQPTQPIVFDKEDGLASKHPSASSGTTSDDHIFMQPTQKYTVESQDAPSKPIHADDIEDDIFMQPTQVFTAEATSPKNHPNESIFMQPTQLIEVSEPHADNSVQDNDIFMQPTQQIMLSDASAKKPTGSRQKSHNFVQTPQKQSRAISPKKQSDESIFMQPTQVIEVPQPKANNSKHDNDDIFMQPTQQIVLSDVPANEPCSSSDSKSDNIMQAPQKHSLSLHKDPTQRNKFDEVESQLEVMFASQTLKMSSQANSRPSNPLANVLDGKQTTDAQQNSEEPETEVNDVLKDEDEDVLKDEDVKSPDSPNGSDIPDDLKEYCAMPTLPIDELVDFQTSSHEAEQKSDNKTRKRRPPKQPSPNRSKGTNADGSPRKRGRPGKIGENEETVAANVTKLDEPTLEKTIKTRSKNASVQEPFPSTSKSNISKKADPIMINKTTNQEVENKNSSNADKEETTEESNTAQTETSLKQNLRSTRTRKSKNVKNISKNINKHDDDGDDDTQNNKMQNNEPSTSMNKINITKSVEDATVPNNSSSEAGGKDVKQEMIEEHTKRQKTNINQPLRASKRTRNNTSGLTEESNISETKEKAAENETCTTRAKDKKQNKPSSKSKEVIEVVTTDRRSLRKKKEDNAVSVITISSDNSDDNSETNSAATPRMSKRTKVIERRQIKGKNAEQILQEETSTSSKPRSTSEEKVPKVLGTKSSEKGKEQPPATEHMQTRRRTPNVETCISNNLQPSTPDVSCSTPVGRRNKRVLSRDSEVGKAKSAVKKMKNSEIEVKSNSDNSEIDFRTPSRNKSHLNVTVSTPERNRRVLKPKIVFTMLNSPELESVARRLGGMVVDTVNACTVLVTGALKRSQKLLSAVGQGKPICSPKWLYECKKANKFLDPWDFILEDEEAESKWNFSLKESLNRSRDKKLLEEYTIHLAVSEAVDVLKAAIESCGGKWVMKVPSKNIETNLIVVSNPTRKTAYSKFLKQNPPLTVVAPEAIFDGVLRQELHWEDHKLS